MFYERFAQLCEEKGTTPCAVTLAAEMSKANVTNWKNGASPTLATVTRLAEELKVPLIELLDTGMSGNKQKEE